MNEVREDKKEIKNAVWTFTNNETKRHIQKTRPTGLNKRVGRVEQISSTNDEVNFITMKGMGMICKKENKYDVSVHT